MPKQLTLYLLKGVTMILFFFIVVIFGNLPINSRAFSQRPLLRAFGGTFAGALFINVALLHILPESAEVLNKKDEGKDQEGFPLANLLMIVGFLITVFFTKVLVSENHDNSSEQDGEDEQQTEKRKPFLEEQEPSSIPGRQNEHNQQNGQRRRHKFQQAYILTIAIYFHTLFEGIAIGVQDTLVGFLSTAVAIGFHKWADALSMGIHYRNKNTPPKIASKLILGQAILNVVAICTGCLLSTEGEEVEAIFLSISAGTFLAISTLELLTHQLNNRQHIKWKYVIMVAATVFVSGVWYIEHSVFT